MTDFSHNAPTAGPIAKAVAAFTSKIVGGGVLSMVSVWRQRQHLDRLPDHLRRDIGLTDAQIKQEVERPLWDAPDHWRR